MKATPGTRSRGGWAAESRPPSGSRSHDYNEPPSTAGGALAVATSQRGRLLSILSILLAFNGVDRIALGLLLQSIKVSLHLSDLQLGVLTGFAFALFYSAVGLPISRWADTGDRVWIISLTTLVWGTMVSLCSAVSTFLELLLVRIGVAVGEAGCIPPSLSLIADHFSRAERPRATAIYFAVNSLVGTVVGELLAGWLNQWFGWRATFFLLGLPGLLLGFVTRKALRDPREIDRGLMTASSTHLLSPQRAPPSVATVIAFLWNNRTFRHLLFSFSVLAFYSYGVSQWQPSFFIRSFGFSTGILGMWLTLIYGGCGTLGTFFGGYLATQVAANNERLQLAGAGALYAAFGIVSVFVYISHSYQISFALLGISVAAGTLATAPMMATIQSLVPPEMRALSITILYLAGNLVGMGLGPLAVGALSDALKAVLGAESLRYALLATCPGYIWGAWHFWRASRTVMKDLNSIRIIESSCK